MKYNIMFWLLVLILIIPFVNADPVLLIDFNITRDGNVTDFGYKVIEGRANPKNEGDCTLMIFDSDNSMLWMSGYDLHFGIFDTTNVYDSVIFKDKIPYDDDMKKISVIYQGMTIYSEELSFCNSDGSCDNNENAISCPDDCIPDEADGICINDPDGFCDPDCLSGYDPDCIEAKNNCGNRRCETKSGENYANCPDDCSGSADGICDMRKDGICDPDCEEKYDHDCREEESQKKDNPMIIPGVIALIVVIIAVGAYMSLKKAKPNNKKQGINPSGGLSTYE